MLLPGFAGTTAPDWLRRRLGEGLGGVVLFGRNVVDDEQVAALTAALRAERDDVVVGIDEEGGDVTRLDVATGSFVPGPLALGAADDPELTTAVAAALGERLAACGVTVNLAPCADLTLAAQDPIIGVRAFGSDPAKASPHVAAYVTGLQKYGVAACAKHFPGHGAATEDSHVALPVLPGPSRNCGRSSWSPSPRRSAPACARSCPATWWCGRGATSRRRSTTWP